MTEEEYFRKNYPDSCYGDRLLSPHWDFFQDGVEFGERQSEKKIADLEKQITALEAKNMELSENWKADHDTLVFYDEKLEKENAELNEQIEKMKNCFNCKHSIYNGGVCDNPNKRYKGCRDFSSW